VVGKVLTVDDEPDILELVRLTLRTGGHEVVTAESGPEALERVQKEHFDVIVLDLTMPGMDGFEVLSTLKSDTDEAVSSIPVILLTARTGQLDRIRGGIEGALHYLTKPFTPQELQQQVAKVLREGPEPQRRREAQRAALEELARMEKGGPSFPGAARPRLTRLDRPASLSRGPATPRYPAISVDAVAALSIKQRELLAAVRACPTVQEAASRLSVSRSNVYASLRRIARRLSVTGAPELVSLIRQGAIPEPPA
jgi:two-component system response regulator VicR